MNERDYLRQIELLARDVVAAASNEGWVSFAADPGTATALQRAVNELARTGRHQHLQGDGCVDEEPVITLGGAALIAPGDSEDSRANYEADCARLGVDAREEGWGLWYVWERAHTMVVTVLQTTRELLGLWAQGRNLHPARPRRSQIAAVVRGWPGPIVLAPGCAAANGLGGV